MSNNPKQAMSVRVLAGCALLTALSVVLSRLMSLIPNELTRFSIEAVPLFIAGLLFGPIPGAMAGFAADFIGCLCAPSQDAPCRAGACRQRPAHARSRA